MCIDMCIDMCMDRCTDLCIDMCVDMHTRPLHLLLQSFLASAHLCLLLLVPIEELADLALMPLLLRLFLLNQLCLLLLEDLPSSQSAY